MKDSTIEIYEAYEARCEKALQEIESLKRDKQYTDDQRESHIKELYARMDADRLETWAEIKGIISKRADEARDRHKLKLSSPEHQQLVGNAMKMLELLGDTISAEQMNNIVAPFAASEDLQTLSILRTYALTKLPEQVGRAVNFPDMQYGEAARHEEMGKVFDSIMRIPVKEFADTGLSRTVRLHLSSETLGYASKE
ncbi:hypothetical protein [Anaerotruncus rubiinfantis]|uniref:hypothetical protein n=1 Tax=Anaerotruncus rubiinfantis TaxID=1720200 RepID=UPI0034A4078C